MSKRQDEMRAAALEAGLSGFRNDARSTVSRKDFFAAAAIQGLLASGEKGTMEVVSKAMNIAKQASEFNFEA